LAGDAKSGYNLPGSIFDREFRCALDLLAKIPTQAYSNINVAEQFLTFNKEHPLVDQTHIVDRNLRRMHDPRYGLNLSDGLRLAQLSLAREARVGRSAHYCKDWFSPRFFATEFWLLWSTLMGSLPQHTIIEFRRYLNRFVYLFPDLSTMANVLISQSNQHEAFVEPLGRLA
jgi:oleate hydratase